MNFKDKLYGCLVCGAIGDSVGGRYEGSDTVDHVDFNFEWAISDDTQLTLATCEAIYNTSGVHPEKIAERFLYWYNCRMLSGLGSSTLKALRELQVGGHWALVGRSGEYAAGNGAAMRIAPLAFKENMDRLTIKDVCNITHKNDEAYTGALAIYYSIHFAITGKWSGGPGLITMVREELADTNVRDRLMELEQYDDLSIIEIGGKYTPTGYVADSVPVAIFAAQKINTLDFKDIMTELILIGGDTDTTCSMTGQIIGALKGREVIPDDWVEKYQHLGIAGIVDEVVGNWKE